MLLEQNQDCVQFHFVFLGRVSLSTAILLYCIFAIEAAEA